VLLALPGSAYIYQGGELGLSEVTDIPDDARQDPRIFRTKGGFPGRDGCRVPLPWSAAGTGFGFSRTREGSSPAEPWLPQPSDWGWYSVEPQLADEHPTGLDTLRWLGPDEVGLLCFARAPGFVLAADLGPAPVPLPAHRDVLLASGPVAGGSLPPDTAVWLGT
jgi:alpha-glucosidase